MNFLIVLLMGFSSWVWPMHLSNWEYKDGVIYAPYVQYMQVPAGTPVDMLLSNPPWVKVGSLWDGETTWLRISEDMILHNSPVYAEHCTQLFNAPDEYKWHCVGKWKVAGPCRHYKDEDGIIHMTCVECYVRDEDGLYDRTKCPVMNVGKLLEMTSQEMEGEK